jgi:glycosyl hydrolase family 99
VSTPRLSTRPRLAALVGSILACFALAAALQAQAAHAAAGVTGPLNPRRCAVPGVQVLSVRTVPALAGVRFELSGRPFTSNRKGIAAIEVTRCGTYTLRVFPPRAPAPGTRTRFARWADEAFKPVRSVLVARSREIQVGFDVEYLVKESFIDLAGKPVAASRVTRVGQSNSMGTRTSFPAGKPQWLFGSRIMRRVNGLQRTEILYSVRSVVVDGTNVVRQAQQRFYPTRTRHFRIRLLLYSAKISSRDRLFNFPIGSSLVLTYPDGHRERHLLSSDKELTLRSLPRGSYEVEIKAPGLKSKIPIALTRNQVVVLKVVSYIDLAFVFGLSMFGAIALLLVRRPRLRARLLSLLLFKWLWRALSPRRAKRVPPGVAGVLALAVVTVALFFGSTSAAAAASPGPAPTLAYYYIWFTPGSWNRAKIDYPLLGRYSSEDTAVMRRHIEWAKSAGINGFIVSWKSTPVLNRRLAKLVRAADAQDFKLSIIYQGLNFEREPLLPGRIARDLKYFEDTYAHERPFDMFTKPVVIWSGTWRFSREEIARVRRATGRRLLILASEKNLEGYERIADLVDGDAYYWSSVNPATFPGYLEKLTGMSESIHSRQGMWIAPAAPGFDARLVGGGSIVDRNGGTTLRQEFDAAVNSSPDAVGVISWNEFSENSHIEPSRSYGPRYLQELADILGADLKIEGDFDSSEAPSRQFSYTIPLLIGLLLVFAAGAGAVLWRRQFRKVGNGPSAASQGEGF